MTKLSGSISLSFLVGLLAATFGSSQSANRLSGKVTDTQGAVLPGATVVATQESSVRGVVENVQIEQPFRRNYLAA
jgi:hypothetical protein